MHICINIQNQGWAKILPKKSFLSNRFSCVPVKLSEKRFKVSNFFKNVKVKWTLYYVRYLY